MLRNRLHFGQAQGTPFTELPLQSDVDWLAQTPAAEQILQGKYTTQLNTPQCVSFLQSCQATTTPDSIPCEVTLDEFRGKLKTWRESTTTSPSGRHLGRYKALFTRVPQDTESSDQPDITFEQKQELIAKLKLSIINYCIRNTYVIQR
jgi:hypothetical protein